MTAVDNLAPTENEWVKGASQKWFDKLFIFVSATIM